MTGSPLDRVYLRRRAFVAAAVAGGFALAGCGRSTSSAMSPPTPLEAAILAAEAARPHTGRTVTASLTPQPATVDLGGTLARTVAYGNAIPAPLIRANVGDELAISVANRLNHPTSVRFSGMGFESLPDQSCRT